MCSGTTNYYFETQIMKQCAIKITSNETKWDSLKEYDQESESADGGCTQIYATVMFINKLIPPHSVNEMRFRKFKKKRKKKKTKRHRSTCNQVLRNCLQLSIAP